ncbi:hypothetical protein BH23PLA1_BH23PLA1_43760 [soil metagenome]
MERTLWTVGYGAWPAPRRAEKLVEALLHRGVTRLVDVRLNPCASDMQPGRPYGPKPWNLQAGTEGIVGLLAGAGIAYEWIVELGNPQRQDPASTILRAQLADPRGEWPVHRGLERLANGVREPEAVVALLCACKEASRCHRSLIAQALADRYFKGALTFRDVRSATIDPVERREGPSSMGAKPEEEEPQRTQRVTEK